MDEPTIAQEAEPKGAPPGRTASAHDGSTDPAGAPRAPEAEPTAEPEPDLEELSARAAERDEYLALAQRTRADFENYRKRVTRDALAAESRAVGRLVRELLPALDNLERALSAAGAEHGEPQGGQLMDGMRLVRDDLTGALARAGVESFDPTGERFDPELHEAIAHHPFAGAEPGTVVEVYQSGYRLNGTLLRAARVVVAAAAPVDVDRGPASGRADERGT